MSNYSLQILFFLMIQNSYPFIINAVVHSSINAFYNWITLSFKKS